MEPTPPTDHRRFASLDLALAVGFAAFAFAGSLTVSAAVNPVIYEDTARLADGRVLRTFNIWFDADFPKARNMMVDRTGDHPGFSAKHPLYRPVAYATKYVLKLFGLTPEQRLRVFAALGSALWAAACFTLLRLMTPHRLDASLFTLLGLSSAAAMFWLSGPESFTLGSVTILVALCAAALADRRPLSAATYVVTSALSLSITVTNWMFGLLLTWLSLPWRRALRYTALALAAVSVAWAAQRLVIPNAAYFLSVGLYDSKFIFHPEAGGPFRVAASFASHTTVMPEITVSTQVDPVWYGMTTQMATPGSAGVLGGIALAAWLVLFGGGLYAASKYPRLTLLRRVLGATLGLQLTLHFIYGRETFLYSLHFLPLLVAVAAFGTLTTWRRPVLALTAVVILIGGANNVLQLRKAIATVDQIGAMTVPTP